MPNSHRDYALIGHLDSFARYRWLFDQLREPDSKPMEDEQLRAYIRAMPPSRVAEILPVEGVRGGPLRGCYIDCYFDPTSLNDPHEMRVALSKVMKGCELAARLGVGVASLGGFTSILGELSRSSGPLIIDRTAFTTGNTLTCYAVLNGTRQMAERRSIDFAGARVLVIGASGDIGSGCTRWLNGRVAHLDLVAQNFRRLQRFMASLPETRTTIEAHEDVRAPARSADIVIGVASTFSCVFDPRIFAPKAIICDVGYPNNFKSIDSCDGPIVFRGGMIRAPAVSDIEPGFFMSELYPNSDIIQGCLAEAPLLALARRREPFSHGRGNITPEKIDEIGSLAKDYGFSVAPPYSAHGYLYPEEQ